MNEDGPDSCVWCRSPLYRDRLCESCWREANLGPQGGGEHVRTGKDYVFTDSAGFPARVVVRKKQA